MSRPSGKFDRRSLLAKLWDLGRTMSTQTVFLHQAIAQSVGLSATDTKCVDLILRGPVGSVTAGRLSDVTGLTTGAVTHIIDRLERRGFVERVRDTDDRRKVLIRVRPESLEPLMPKYEEVGNAYMRLAKQYGNKELALLCDYMERISEISERELARMIAANRSASLQGRVRPSPSAQSPLRTRRHAKKPSSAKSHGTPTGEG